MALVITIGGVAQSILDSSITINDAINNPASATIVLQSLDRSTRPTLDTEVIITDGGVQIFGGWASTGLLERGIGDSNVSIETEINCIDFNSGLRRAFYFEPTIEAGTVKEQVTPLIDFLSGFSFTVDAAQDDGPALDAIAPVTALIADYLDNIAIRAGGWVYRVNFDKKFRMWEPGTLTAPIDIGVGGVWPIGDLTVEPTRQDYANQILLVGNGVTSIATDAAEIAAHSFYQALYTDTSITDQTACDNQAAAILARSTPILKRIKFVLHDSAVLRPGMILNVAYPIRNLNGVYLITEVVTRSLRGGNSHQLERTVTAIEGLVYKTGWREQYKTLQAGGGGTFVSSGGGTTGATAVRPPFQFGGVDTVWERTDTPGVWKFFSDGIIQEIDTIPRGTTSGTIDVWLSARNGSVGVKVRLVDITAPTVSLGESTNRISTTPVKETFSVTLTNGSHDYAFQYLADATGEDIRATAKVLR